MFISALTCHCGEYLCTLPAEYHEGAGGRHGCQWRHVSKASCGEVKEYTVSMHFNMCCINRNARAGIERRFGKAKQNKVVLLGFPSAGVGLGSKSKRMNTIF